MRYSSNIIEDHIVIWKVCWRAAILLDELHVAVSKSSSHRSPGGNPVHFRLPAARVLNLSFRELSSYLEKWVLS